MVKYLQMDGVDDNLKMPSMTYNKIVVDALVNSSTSTESYLFDSQSRGSGGYIRFTNTGAIQNNMAQSGFVLNSRTITTGTIIAPYTGGTSFFSRYDNPSRASGKIFNIKYYNGESLVAHYDMSTGTVQDQSGNGRHATLTGGTWLDDGTGGTPTGEDGSVSVDTKQLMYQDGANPFDIRNILYQDGSTSSDTKQVLYQISSTSFDMLQEIFNDGQVGSTPFDMRFLLYADGSILHDSRQVTYESGQNAFDLSQAIYESGEGKADIHLVLFADSSTHHDLIQSLYEDAQVQFDTRQTLFDTDKQVIGVIPLKGNRELYVYLAGRQQLSFPLKGKQDLFINLRGDVNVTIDNGLFKMYAGDSKYLPISVEGVTDFSGATAKWALMPSVYSTEHTLLKTIGDGISITDGKLQVKLDSVDTKNLLGKFYFETELTDALGNVSTIAVGEIEIKKSGV